MQLVSVDLYSQFPLVPLTLPSTLFQRLSRSEVGDCHVPEKLIMTSQHRVLHCIPLHTCMHTHTQSYFSFLIPHSQSGAGR